MLFRSVYVKSQVCDNIKNHFKIIIYFEFNFLKASMLNLKIK